MLDCIYKTNQFKSTPLNIVSTTCLNTTFYVTFRFLVKEEEDDYIWTMEQLKSLYRPGTSSGMIPMDRELALTNMIRHVFPQTQRLLCIWHVKKVCLCMRLKEFEKGEEREAFMKAWVEVISSGSDATYEGKWLALQERI